MPISLRTLYLVTAVLCNIQRSLEHEIPRRSFLSRRAIDGTRGRKYFDPNEEGAFDSYGSAGGQYDPYDHVTDLSDIRKNVPGEPGVDYPAYTTLPQTGFTCEGRSRGYYADEAAGCQVFHVCHDVLVSSFLCPIGSTFSQKLLTCDWWTKVDCSTTSRYLEINRNNYQIDDDEMIRNAYAMISLQSTEDVTKDGLVDPDSGARIIDYSALASKTMGGYTSGSQRRITDYPAVDATGNDLPNGFEDYPHRRVLDYNHYQQKMVKTVHQNKFRIEDKGHSPYHASPIIQYGYHGRSGHSEFQDDYRRPEGFTNQLQASYAPTVPTVTTTTRRLYSPTVPTTYRPSTLSYSKLDLLMDSSDHLYAHSKSSVTPPTTTRQNDGLKDIDSRASETRHGELKKSTSISISKMDSDDSNVEEKSEPIFRINVTDATNEDEVFRQQNDRPVIRNNESAEDIEAKDSIGIVRALNNPHTRIIVQNQDPVDSALKNERPSLRKSVALAGNGDATENYETVANTTTRSFEQTVYTGSFGDRTTPLLASRNWRQKDDTSSRAANITTKSVEEVRSEPTEHPSSDDARTTVAQNSSSKSVFSFNDKPAFEMDLGVEAPPPALFLRPPLEGFFINVPEEIRYPETTSTKIPPFSSTLSASKQDETPLYSENIDEQSLIDYADEGLSKTPDLIHTTDRTIIEASTPTLWHDRLVVNVPVTDIVPPIVDYNDGFDDFVPPDSDMNERSHTAQFYYTERVETRRAQSTPATPRTNDSETEILNRYNTGFQFTIRDAIKTQQGSRVDSKSPCYSTPTLDKETGLCETSSVTPRITASTLSAEQKTISIGTRATTKIPKQLISSNNAKSLEKSVTFVPESATFITQPTIIVDGNVAEGSTLKTITPRNVLRIEESNGKIEQTMETTTTNALLHSRSRPGPLKQIEEMIDRHNSPYEVSLTVKKDESLEPTTKDFISRLIAQHQRPTSALKDQLSDFEIVKSLESEDEIAVGTQASKFPESSRTSPSAITSGSFSLNNTVDQFKQSDSNVSMLSLLQLMAELLKLDRLPRPFSTQDLYNVELDASSNLGVDEPSTATTAPLLDRSANRTPLNNAYSKTSSFNPPNIASTVTFGLSPDGSAGMHLDRAKKPKTSQLKPESRTARPLHKQEILEQLTENFGQPLYNVDSINRSPLFDLPQVQRNLDFETGLPIAENKRVTSEIGRKGSISPTAEETTTITTSTTAIKEMTTTTQRTTTAAESEKIVETEFVPSLGFSFDTNEGREEYVEAVLGGLIDEHHTSDVSRNESNIAQLTRETPKNGTSIPAEHENSKST